MPNTPERVQGKLLLDVNEVCEVTGLGRSHLYRYLLRGDLRSAKFGRRRKVSVTALLDFIKKLEEQQADGEPEYGDDG